jgi:hypothetical protein
MVRPILSLAILALWLASAGVPARAQATADQLNKLSLEALTAPPSRSAGGYAPTPHRAPARSYRSYRRATPRYRTAPRHRATRPYRYSRPRGHAAAPHAHRPGAHRASPHAPNAPRRSHR